jgi:hypothetical protein
MPAAAGRNCAVPATVGLGCFVWVCEWLTVLLACATCMVRGSVRKTQTQRLAQHLACLICAGMLTLCAPLCCAGATVAFACAVNWCLQLFAVSPAVVAAHL